MPSGVKKIADIYKEPELVDTIIKGRIARAKAKDGKTHLAKWTPEELEIRNAVIYGYLINDCNTREECARKIAERWDISNNTARNYIKEAMRALVANYQDVSKEQIKETYLKRIEKLLQKAVNEGKTKEALQAAEMLNKLDGLYNEKIDLNLQGNITFDFKE